MPITPTQEELSQLLLVEDSDTSAALIIRHLSGHYNVLHARDGEEAWNMLSAESKIDLVVTDIQMPRLNGHELLLKIRRSEKSRLNSLPVIVMTSANDDSERNLAFTNGANDFLTKPIDPVELQARVGVHQKLARTIRELETHRHLLQEQATTDPLTKLKNRRAFSEFGLQHFLLAQRHGSDLSVIEFDIDHFKKINDTYGHPGGDEVLIAVAKMLIANIRTSDVAARLGGEEFALLLPNTNRVGSAVLAERIRAAIENNKFSVAGKTLSLTVSAGVASFGASTRDSLDQLMQVADRRLYMAKQSGRNRVVISDASRSGARGDTSGAAE